MKTVIFNWIILILVTHVHSNHITICSDNTYFGEDPANENNDETVTGGSTNGRGYILGSTLYEINCCGFLDQYEVKVSGVGDLVFQLWRLDSSTTYQLVYQNTTTTTAGINTIALDSSVAVTSGDRWGWWVSGAPLVMYEHTTSCSSTCSTDYKTLTSLNVNDLQDWSGTTNQNDKYGIRLRVNSNAVPSFTNLPNTTTIADTTTIGTTVFTVTSTDADAGDIASLTFTIASGDITSYFDFIPATGAVTVIFNLASATSPVVLTLTVTDQCHQSGTGTLSVTITNVPPIIYLLPNSTSISEIITASTVLHSFSYSDPGDTVTCSITSPAGVPFTLTQTGTDLVLTSDANPGFNYTDTSTYVLEITCTDSKDPTVSNFTVNILENFGPIINNLGNFTEMSEDVTTEILVYTLDVTDPEGDDFNCSLDSASSTPTSVATYFDVRLLTGSSAWAIYTQASVAFNYSSFHTFNLRILCQDERKSNQGTFNVYITANTAPYFTNLPSSITLATTAAVGYTIYSFSYNDLEGDTGTYSIVCDPTGCPFTLLQSGVIQLNTSIQRTNITGYDVTATVSDARRTSKAKVLTVLISGINDKPSISNLAATFAVSENSAFSTSVVTTLCQDSNTGDTLVYSMTCSGSGLTYFTISTSVSEQPSYILIVDVETPFSNTGDTLVYSMTCSRSYLTYFTSSSPGTISTSSTVNINYETIAAAGSTLFSCDVTCSDGQDSDTKSVGLQIVNINEAPYFGQSAYSITSNEGVAGTVLSSTGFAVSDDDSGDSSTFKLDCGSSSPYFSMNKNSGAVSYQSDYDVDDGIRPTSLTCTVVATDLTGLTATATVDITINNINDNSPVFVSGSYTFFADVSTALNTVLGTVTARDADIGSFGTITYTVNNTLLSVDYFGVSSNGDIYVKTSLASLGVESVASFSILASDAGGLSATSDIKVVTYPLTVASVYVDSTRYRTFFEEPKNIPWFMACILTLLVIFGVTVYLIMTKQTPSCPFVLKCCKLRKVYNPSMPQTRPRRFPKAESKLEGKKKKVTAAMATDVAVSMHLSTETNSRTTT